MVPYGDHGTESINHLCHCTHKLYQKNMQTQVMFKDRYIHCREIIEIAVLETLHVHFMITLLQMLQHCPQINDLTVNHFKIAES